MGLLFVSMYSGYSDLNPKSNKQKFLEIHNFLNFWPTLMGTAFRHDWVPHLLSKVIDAPLPRLASIRIHGSEDWMWQLMHSRQHNKLQKKSLIIPKPKMQKMCHSVFKSRLMLLLRILFTCKLIWNIYAKFKKSQPPYSQDIFPIAQSSISVRGGVNGVKKCWFKRSAEWNFLTLLSANSSLCRVYCTSEQYTYRQQLPTAAGVPPWGRNLSKKFSKPLLDQKNETSKMYPEIVKVLCTYI